MLLDFISGVRQDVRRTDEDVLSRDSGGGVHRILTGLLLITVGFTTSPAAAQVLFQEDFNGPSLDAAKWSVNPGGGTLEFLNGRLILSAPCSARFPYVRAVSSPFPESGDFTVRVGFRYVGVQQGGNGFSCTAQNCDGYSCLAGIAVWQDYCCGGLRAVVGPTVVGLAAPPNTADHIYQWELVGTTYSFFLDGAPLGTAQATARPTGFWFGHPPYNYCPWSSQEIDFIQVLLPGTTATAAHSWGRVKSLYR